MLIVEIVVWDAHCKCPHDLGRILPIIQFSYIWKKIKLLFEISYSIFYLRALLTEREKECWVYKNTITFLI